MPGLYFVGLKFLYSFSSEQIHGVGRDAAHIAAAIPARRGNSPRGPEVADQLLLRKGRMGQASTLSA